MDKIYEHIEEIILEKHKNENYSSFEVVLDELTTNERKEIEKELLHYDMEIIDYKTIASHEWRTKLYIRKVYDD